MLKLEVIFVFFLLLAPITIDCEGTVTQVTIPETIIQSPNYPNDYLNNQDCKAVVKFAQGQKVFVEFLAFNVEPHTNCSYDWLEIRDGIDSNANLLASRKCENQTLAPIESSGNTLHLHFHTDNSQTRSGFQLRVHNRGMHFFLE